MAALLTLPERITAAKICKAVINEFSSCQNVISKVESITTDGGPSMTEEKAGFVNLLIIA